MSHYQQLSISEREKILVLRTEGKSIRRIAAEIARSVSTVSREIKRNGRSDQSYSAVEAQRKYLHRRKKCRRHKLLLNASLKETVMRLFLEEQWPPEQRRSKGNRGAIRNLRHRGKTRRRKGTEETRGKIVISNRIQERPKEADSRKVIGHWEADTLAGKTGSACLVTITDRCSRYLLAGKVGKRCSALVAEKMISLLSVLPRKKCRTITPDRGKEFSKHTSVTKELGGVQFYFPDPHAPWQRGTNENTNGLIREYLPKSFDIALSSEDDIAKFIRTLNFRPRKCLGWKTPYEVFFSKALHLT